MYTAGIVLIVISGICIVVGIILIILVCVIGANSKTTPAVSTSLIIQWKTLNFLCDESNKRSARSECFPCRAIWIASYEPDFAIYCKWSLRKFCFSIWKKNILKHDCFSDHNTNSSCSTIATGIPQCRSLFPSHILCSPITPHFS